MNNAISKEALDFLEECSKNGIALGLETMTELMSQLGNPQNSLNVIHIAGTNGKGSVGAFIQGILMKMGKRVGRYVSPAVFCDLEKYSINKENIEPQEFNECITLIKAAVHKMCDNGFKSATVFEAETALAFLYFARSNCDYVIVEVGMGGRLDATNVITSPVLSVITQIGIDHIGYLGNTIEEIAGEKCGIIKTNVPVVSAIQKADVKEIVEEYSHSKNAKLTFAKEAQYKSFWDNKQYFDYDNIENIELNALGLYQLQNAALAIEAVRVLENVDNETIKAGLKDVIWRGRFEIIYDKPLFVLDGAHNKDGVLALMQSVDEYFKGKDIIYITGTFADKDYRETAKITAPRAKKIYAITPPTSRGLDGEEYAKVLRKYNKNVCAVSLNEAVRECRKEENSIILCFGSLSFLADIKKEVENE